MAGVVPRGEFHEILAQQIEQSIPQRFEQQVDRFAGRIAVKTANVELTYAELDEWANRIALAILARRGAQPDAVGLLLGQGAVSAAATLGVLKAGKFYVPLDPFYPPARLAGMLEWVGVPLLVTAASHADLAASLASSSDGIVVADRLGDHDGVGRPGVHISPDATAYVFFTSGSTGAPKGVFDSHRNVLHNIRRYTNALAIGPDDRMTLVQSPAFSGSVSSLFSALLNGAAVYPFSVADEGPRGLADLLVRERLTMYHSVPTLFRSVMGGGAHFPDLRVIRLEGDRASSHDVALFQQQCDPTCLLANGLGTTETGLCRQYLVGRDAEIQEGILPVGYPVCDMDVSILREDGTEAEPGQSGEIAVRSRYLALGYWRRPDLTAAAFSRDLAGGPARVYRTGDLGRMGADGCLLYLARKDSQLKVRGHRVDVAEVESVLLATDGVREGVVSTRENARGEAELVAYLVPVQAVPPDTEVVRAALARTLPPHLIPSRVQWLTHLPLGENGKVDRNSLPAPDEVSRNRPVTAPRDALERLLVRIWEDVLAVRPIGIDDRLVDLGADSLARGVIVSRIQSETGSHLSAGALADDWTVARLAEVLRNPESRPDSSLVAIKPEGSRPSLFLVHSVFGQVSHYTALAGRLGPDQPVWGLTPTGPLDTIEREAARYVTEIRRLQPMGPYRLGGWCFGAVIAFEMAHQLHASGERVALLALMGITAWDFPTLVAPAAWRRYQRTHERGRDSFPTQARRHLTVAGGLGAAAGARYLARKGASLISRVRTQTFGRLAGSPSGEPESADRLIAMAKADEACARYVPTPVAGRPVLFLSDEGTASYSRDPVSDWRRLGAEGVDVRLIPGSDTGILEIPQVGELAKQLDELLAALPDSRRTGL